MTWSREPTSHDDYARIFDARGAAYHAAMRRWPRARDEEFQRAVSLADLREGLCIGDFPSGGGYLRSYLPTPRRLVLLESSRAFYECAAEADEPYVERRLVADGRFPLDDASLDRVVSVAGLHHLHDRASIFGELRRCLRAGGRLAIADVAADSAPARFLDEFVDEYSEEGHEGRFLDASTADELSACGFVVRTAERQAYPWRFPDRAALVEYCRLLFGLVRATPSQIDEALDAYLGVAERNGVVELNWELYFFAADAPPGR